MAECRAVITSWPTDCPFAEVGCIRLLSNCQEYSQHLAENIEQHLQMVMDLHKGEVISPLQKLNAIRSETEYLEGTLECLGVRQLPALECIKTQMKQPGVVIGTLGDKCAFRMSSFTKLRDSNEKWCSPVFSLREKHNLRLVVFPNGIGSGRDTHLSVRLVTGGEFEWPLKLPKHLGIRVELLVETDGSVPDIDSSDSDNSEATDQVDEPCTHVFVWRPRSRQQHYLPKAKVIEEKELHRRVSKILPPWCQPPVAPQPSPTLEETDGTVEQKVTRLKRQKKAVEEMRSEDGMALYTVEKFATRSEVDNLIQEFNSLVFQISICLLALPKSEV